MQKQSKRSVLVATNTGIKARSISRRVGHLAVQSAVLTAAVAAWTAGARPAKADITNGFAGFAAPNINATNPAGIGYNVSAGTFQLTNNQNSEAVSGFASTPQVITSFDATYTYTATGSADGGAFVIQNNASGTGALGNTGGAGGYQGITNSAGLQVEYFNQNSVGFSTGGANPTNYASTQNVVLTNGDPIQVTVEYFNNTVTANFVDLTTGKAGARIFAGQNISAAIGGNTGYVGFTGGTGGLASTLTVSNFTFVSGSTATGNRIYNPIAISGYNQQGVISKALGQAAVTATMDTGTTKTGDTWYEQGWNTFNTSTGIPASGSTFTSKADNSHTFTMANYSANDVFLLNGANTGTMTFNTPAAYSELSFLTASGNGPSSFKVTINYSDGATATSNLSVISPDWFNGSPSAWTANGRDTLTKAASAQPDNYAGGQPNLYEEDLILPNSSDPIASINMTYAAGGNIMVFAVSGVVANNTISLVYNGASPNAGKFDKSSFTFGVNTSTGTPAAFGTGALVTFDDTATDPVHNITVAAVSGGINPAALVFGNTTNTSGYTFTGAGIGGTGGITMNGNGSVTFNNPNTFTGDANIYAGTLNIGTGGALASNNITLSNGAVLNVTGTGALTGTALNVSNAGIINFNGAALSLIGLNGSGQLNSTNATGTNLTLGGSGTYSGTVNLNAGSVTMNANGSTATLSGSNSYSGGTFLKAGTLLVGNGSLGSGTVNNQGGAIGAASANVNVTNLIAGGALIAASGTNTLELSNTANTFTGPVVVQSGTLKVDGAGSIGTATSIIVATGGSFEVNYSQTNAGAGTTTVISGAGPTSTYANPIPNGATGAFRGGDGITSTWAGNINVSGPANIQPGVDGTLVLTGSISGTGPVTYTFNTNDVNGATIILAPGAGQSNTYTGETRFVPDVNVNTAGPSSLQLGANNGISPNSGLNIVTGSAAEFVTVDTQGFNQSLTYLTGGAQSGYVVQNSGGNTSTITITSGLKAGAPANFATTIQGGIALVMNDPTGAGNQIISGTNTYTGGTTITKGTLTAASAQAFSTNAVTLKGGTLGLAAIITPATPIVTSNDFPNFTANVLAGSTGGAPTQSGGTLTLTNNVANTSVSSFFPTPVTVNNKLGFTASFTYSIPAGYADGMTFVLQNDPRGAAAVGAGGGELGYGGAGLITNSAAVEFNIYSFAGAGEGTNFESNGVVPGDANSPGGTFINTSPVNLALINIGGTQYLDNANAIINVSLVYNGPAQTLTETLFNTKENQTFTTTYTGVDYQALVGGSTAYVGFTAATGGIGATQQISNFSYGTNLSAPQSISNEIDAPTGSSAIQLGLTSGSTTTSATVGLINIGSGAIVAVTTPVSTTTGSTRGVLVTPSVTIASASGAFTGKLDLTSNDLDVNGGSMTIGQLTAMVASGYKNGAWNGNGITSSVAAADSSHLTALGVIVNTGLYGSGGTISSTFDGSTPNNGDLLIKFTYYGDANLDGAVDGTDYSRIDASFASERGGGTNVSGWYNGDFNYDGVVNGSDYTLIDNAFNSQGTTLGSNPLAQLATSTSQIAGAPAVPEPTSLGLLAVGAGALLGRRRRQFNA